jgi:putative ABC transport system ATP-binding protein
MSDMPLIRLTDVSKIYHLESGDYIALDHVSLDIAENEFVAIMGPSGSGKSTMMNQLGILDVPSTGELFIAGQNVAKMSSLERTHMRRDIIGYIFQKFYLIPLLSAYENVEYPLILKYKKRDTSGRAAEYLKAVGIDPVMSALTGPTSCPAVSSSVSPLHELSSTIQRSSSVMSPQAISTARPVSRLWRSSVTLHRKGKTVIIVTHDPNIAAIRPADNPSC